MAKRSGSAHSFTGEERVVIIRGKETFLRDHYTDALRAALEAKHGAIGIFRFDGTTVDLADVLDELRSYDLMHSYKLVILDDADAFLKGKKPDDDPDAKAADSPNRAALGAYAENPVDHATLLLRSETWNPGKLDKAAAKVGAVIKADQVKQPQAASWCVNRARERYGIAIDERAANLLVERAGCWLGNLDTELAKLAALVEPGGTIGLEDIRDMVGLTSEEAGWIIQDAVFSGDPGVAITKFRELRELSQQPEEVLMWSLIEAARKLHHASRMLHHKVPAGAIRKELKLFGPSVDRLLAAARNGEPHTYAQLLHRAIQLDAHRKTGQASKTRSLECLAAEIADTVGSGSRR